MNRESKKDRRSAGFTLIELLVGNLIMLIVVVGALSIYVRSNKVSADQQQYARVQQDVRAAMYYLARDVRMAGAELPSNFQCNALEGVDNEDQGGSVRPDRLTIMGEIDEPFKMTIQSCEGKGTKIKLEDNSLDQYPYPDDYYIGKIVLLLPKPGSTCQGGAIRQITNVKHKKKDNEESFEFSPKATTINPPNGLRDICEDGEFDGGLVFFNYIKQYWLDVTGNAPGLTAGVNGYIGGGAAGVLYVTNNDVHYPLAQNIENIQFQYNGNFDGDSAGTLDGFTDWKNTWTLQQIGTIRQVRMLVLGQTPDRFVSVSAAPSGSTYLYRRPAVGNSPAADSDDGHKRFILESTSNLRNISLNIYNTGQR
jgi:type II secretory pathway pseudopilin PulG